MYIQMLKNQSVTFVSDVEQAKKHSPFYHWYNPYSERWCVNRVVDGQVGHNTVAAGLSQPEAEACVMFKANEFILRNVQKNP